MTIEIENVSEKELPLDYKEVTGRVIEEVLDFESCPYEVEVDVMLTSDTEIQKINLEHRKLDSPTDVLSFPLADYPAPADFTLVEERETHYFNPGTGELMLGDIIISVDKVLEQADKYGHPAEREYAFLIAHSMLHLLGYDHMTEEEAGIMEARQNAILNRLNIKR